MKILWMTPKWTLPATDGARIATEKLLTSTIKAGAEVDILCLPQKGEQINIDDMLEKWNIGAVYIEERSLPQRSLAKAFYYLKSLIRYINLPLTFSSFHSSRIKNRIENLINGGGYSHILLDGLHLGIPFAYGRKLILRKDIKIIYRAHNIEYDLWKDTYEREKNFLKKLFFKYQFFLVKKVELSICRFSDMIAYISSEDKKELSQYQVRSKHELVPLGLNFDEPLPPNKQVEITKVLFVGRLDWSPNRDGLEWLLTDIWPEVMKMRNDIELIIAGSGNSSWIDKYKNIKGVHFLGFVDHINDAYSPCHYNIVPMRFGSGTRIKVVESYAKGRPLISTKMGVQGASLESSDYFLAETTQEWIETLTSLKPSAEAIQMAEAARVKLRDYFDTDKVGEKFYSLIKSL